MATSHGINTKAPLYFSDGRRYQVQEVCVHKSGHETLCCSLEVLDCKRQDYYEFRCYYQGTWETQLGCNSKADLERVIVNHSLHAVRRHLFINRQSRNRSVCDRYIALRFELMNI